MCTTAVVYIAVLSVEIAFSDSATMKVAVNEDDDLLKLPTGKAEFFFGAGRLYPKPSNNADPAPQDHASPSVGWYSGKDDAIQRILTKLHLMSLLPLFRKHMISDEILLSLTEADLEKIGIEQLGCRRVIMQEIAKLREVAEAEMLPVPLLTPVPQTDEIYGFIEFGMQSTIRSHRGTKDYFSRYRIIKIQRVNNDKLWKRFENAKKDFEVDSVDINEKTVYHGTNVATAIITDGFDLRKANVKGMFGAAAYFAETSSKANLYAFGAVGSPCPDHEEPSCMICHREMLICKILLGHTSVRTKELKGGGHGPEGRNSVTGLPSPGELDYYEYAIFRTEQIYPAFLVTYTTAQAEVPEDDEE